jgi:NAD(P)-dependent dehydrogenase (short-subunit alcohol dehydrogenase family)
MVLRDLSGQAVLVTGAGSGIGRAAAVRLGAEGMRVGVLARTASDLDATATMVRDAGGEALVLCCDLRDAKAAHAAVGEAAGRFGRLDALVNNAAVAAFRQVESMDVAHFDEVIATNLRGAFVCIMAALPHLRAAGSGRIVNVASRAAQEGYPYLSAYSASKHGLVGLSEAIDAELEDEPIRCHTVIVGSVDTPFHAATFEGADPGLAATILEGARLSREQPRPDPVGMLQPEDVAEAVAFLLRLPDRVHVQPIVLRPSHDSGPADLARVVRRGRTPG